MRQIRPLTIPFLVLLGLIFAAVSPSIVWADDDDPIEIEFTGVVTSIDEGEGSGDRTLAVVVETDNHRISFVVYPPDDFDWSVEPGDAVEVEGVVTGEWIVTATKVEVEEEEPVEIEFAGIVTAIDQGNRTITVVVEMGDGSEEYVVHVPDDFDLDGLAVGDVVEVEGTLQDDDSILAEKVKVEDDDDDDGNDDDAEGDHGHYCRNLDDPDIVHPVGGAIAERYEVGYEEIMGWFCEESMGFGQIMLALQTATGGEEDGDSSYEEFLERRIAGEGWGQIWQDLGLIGRPKDADPPEGEEIEWQLRESQGSGAGKTKLKEDDRATGKPEQLDEVENPNKPDKSEKPGKPDKPDKVNRPEEPQRPEKPEKPDKPDKPEKPDKSQKPDKPGKP
jgi:hypothetical protein